MAKIVLLMQLLVLQTAYFVGGQHLGQLESDWLLLGSYPENCKPDNNCAYKASMKYNPELNAMLLDVIGPCDENLALAVGFTRDNNLKGIDLVWGFFTKNKESKILHGPMPDATRAPVPYKDSVLLNSKLTKRGEICHLQFTHPRVSKIVNDFQFKDNSSFYAVLPQNGLTIKNEVAVGFPKRPLLSNLINMNVILGNVREKTPEIRLAYPLNCEKTSSCEYVVDVKLDEDADLVRVAVSAKIHDKKNKLCSGIGFSRNKTMMGMDLVYGCQDNKMYHVLFENSTTKFKPYPNLDLPEATVVQKDGHLVLNFAHKRRPSNKGDFCFVKGECYYFWYPYGGMTMLDNTGAIDVKNVKYIYSLHKICVECPEEITTIEPTTWPFDVESTTFEPETTTCDHETTEMVEDTTTCHHDETTEPGTTEILDWTTSEEPGTTETWPTEEHESTTCKHSPTPDDIKLPTSTVTPCRALKGICYYNSSAQFRQGAAKFLPKDMLTSLCSHATFSWAKILKNKLVPSDPSDSILYKEFNDRKLTEPKLKTFLAVGGLNFPVQEMTTMLSSSSNRNTFIKSVIDLLRLHKFDGLDLHCDVVEIKAKSQFTLLIQELRKAFNDEVARDSKKIPLLLMVSVCAIVDKITCDVKSIHKNADFMHLKAFDYHTSLEKKTALNAPLFHGQGQDAKLNIDYSAKYMVSAGIPVTKLIIGMPLSGLGYTLVDAKNHDLAALVKEPSKKGKYTMEPGFLSYYEVCLLLRAYSTKTVWLDEQKASYLYVNDQWISYEDEKSLTIKMDWLKKNGYGGWSAVDMSLDDFVGDKCQKGPFPLISLLKKLDYECPEITTPPSTTLSKILSSTTTKHVTTTKTTTKPTTTTKIITKPPTTTKTTTKPSTTTKIITKPPTTTKTTTRHIIPTTKTTKKLLPPTSTIVKTTSHTTMKTTTMPHITCKSYGKVEDPSDCKGYVICSHGVAVKKMKCENDWYFDPESSKCMDASDLPPKRKSECYIPQ